MEYEQLLERAYKSIKIVETGSERFECPRAKGFISGKNTIITNMKEISSCIRRPMEHIVKFLQRELATPGRLSNDRLILNAKINSNRVNDKIELYVKEFVLCHECKKPDTEIISEKSAKFKHCLACGAKYPIKSRI